MVHHTDQLVNFRLGSVTIGLDRIALDLHRRINQRREQQHGDVYVAQILLGLTTQGQAIHPGHFNITDQKKKAVTKIIPCFLSLLLQIKYPRLQITPGNAMISISLVPLSNNISCFPDSLIIESPLENYLYNFITTRHKVEP